MEIKKICDEKPKLPPPEFELRVSHIEMGVLRKALSVYRSVSYVATVYKEAALLLEKDLVGAKPKDETTDEVRDYVRMREC